MATGDRLPLDARPACGLKSGSPSNRVCAAGSVRAPAPNTSPVRCLPLWHGTLLSAICLVAMLTLTGCDSPKSGGEPNPSSSARPPAHPTAATPIPQPKPTPVPRVNLDATFPIDEWKTLFDGGSLSGWKITDFAGRGSVEIQRNFKGAPAIILEQGASLSGITFTNGTPKIDYEISFEAARLLGEDFFCGLTFPVDESFCTFVVGGWGGSIVGISSVDGADASMNETTKFMKFENDKWYRMRIRVTQKKIEAWIDQEKSVDLERSDKKISMRLGEIEESIPFGYATWQTSAAIRDFKLRRLPPSGSK